eukprot:ANDGO_03917.mRNA.1 Importin beta-like protein kap113
MDTSEPVLLAIQQSFSADASIRQRAEAELSALEQTPGFLMVLLEIAGNGFVPSDIRLAAIIFFKNSVHKRWGNSMGSIISEADRDRIRKTLVSPSAVFLGDSQDLRLCTQMFIAIAKIARFDFPEKWGTLLGDISERIDCASGSVSVVCRCFMLLHHILIELASRRFQWHITDFESMAPKILEFVYKHWSAAMKRDLRLQSVQQLVRFTTKCARTLAIHGFSAYLDGGICELFFKSCISSLSPLVFASETRGCAVYVLKMLQNAFQKSALLFLPFVDSVLQSLIPFLFGSNVSTVHHPTEESKRSYLLALNLVASILAAPQYRPSSYCDGTDTEMFAFSVLQRHFGSRDKLEFLLRAAIFDLMTVPSDFAGLMDSDPEEFAEEEERETGDVSFGAAADRFLNSLFLLFEEDCKGPFAELVQKVSMGSVVLADCHQESFYRALNLVSSFLYDAVDISVLFPSLIAGPLQHQCATSASSANIRRIVQTIGKFSDQYTQDTRVLSLQILQHVLSHPHPLVRLAACRSLREIVDDVGFEESLIEQSFGSFLGVLTQQFELLLSPESHFQILSTLKVLFIRCPSRGSTDLDLFVCNVLPALWRYHAHSPMMQASILMCLESIVENIPYLTSAMFHVCFQFLHWSLSDHANPVFSAYILDPSLDLWSAVLRARSPTVSEQDIRVLSLLPSISFGSEQAPHVLRICELHLLSINDASQLQFIGQSIYSVLHCLMKYLDDVSLLSWCSVYHVLLMILQMSGIRSLETISGPVDDLLLLFSSIGSRSFKPVLCLTEMMCRSVCLDPGVIEKLVKDVRLEDLIAFVLGQSAVSPTPCTRKSFCFALLDFLVFHASENAALISQSILPVFAFVEQTAAIWNSPEMPQRLALELESRMKYLNEGDMWEEDDEEHKPDDAYTIGGLEIYDEIGSSAFPDLDVQNRKRYLMRTVDPIVNGQIQDVVARALKKLQDELGERYSSVVVEQLSSHPPVV